MSSEYPAFETVVIILIYFVSIRFDPQALSSLGGGKQLTLSIRDVLSWAGFVTASLSKRPLTRVDRSNFVLKPWEAYVHGAALVLLDGMGLGAALSPAALASLKKACVAVLTEQVIFAVASRIYYDTLGFYIEF